jgi:hypothetical protein
MAIPILQPLLLISCFDQLLNLTYPLLKFSKDCQNLQKIANISYFEFLD